MTEIPVDQWQMLRFGEGTYSDLETPTLPSSTSNELGFVRYALSKHGDARLLIPIKNGQSLIELQSTDSLEIGGISLKDSERTIYFLDIKCVNPLLEAAFSEVTIELLRRIRNGGSTLTSVSETLQDFKSLFTIEKNHKLSLSTVVGLAAELLVLDHLLSLNPMAWKIWKGPFAERHDFRIDKRAIEVKCTTRASRNKIKISSIDQLQAPENGDLYLVHIVLEEVHNGGLTLEGIISNIFSKASNIRDIKNILKELGYESNSKKWNAYRFHLDKTSMYHIGENFPRLVLSSFPNKMMPSGVSNVTYELDLTSASDFLLEKSEENQILENMALCIK